MAMGVTFFVATLFLLVSLWGTAESGKMLLFGPYVTRSHVITFQPLLRELADRGHEVTVLSPFSIFKNSSANIRELTYPNTIARDLEQLSEDQLGGKLGAFETLGRYFSIYFEAIDAGLSYEGTRALLNDPSTQFDVVLVYPFFGNEAGYYLAHRFNASLALYFSTQTAASWVDHALGQPHNPSYLPCNLLPFTTDMTFPQRVVNVAVGLLAHHAMRSHYMLGKTREILRRHFPGEDLPDLVDLERTASVAFSFGHPLLLDGWRPQTPNHIYLGMMNCRGTPELDGASELKRFLDDATEGVVFMSFGTVLRGASMPDPTRKLFLAQFAKLDQKVLWKWETETMEDLPPNVRLSKWLPQQEVLAHPNVMLFITHAGQSSFQESLCHGKPMITIPVLGDQLGNGAEVERLGLGFNVPFKNFNEEKFSLALKTILEDPSYQTRASDFGKILMDQINTPLDRAVWWIEHVMRHPTLYSGRSPIHKLYWFQYFLLDVIAFYLALIFIFLVVLIKCLRICCCGKSRNNFQHSSLILK